jgi:hypothetical protein
VASKSGKRFRTGTFPEQNLSVLIPGSKLHFSCHLTCRSILRSEQEPLRSATIKEKAESKKHEADRVVPSPVLSFSASDILVCEQQQGGLSKNDPTASHNLILFCVILAIQSPNPQLQAHPRFRFHASIIYCSSLELHYSSISIRFAISKSSMEKRGEKRDATAAAAAAEPRKRAHTAVGDIGNKMKRTLATSCFDGGSDFIGCTGSEVYEKLKERKARDKRKRREAARKLGDKVGVVPGVVDLARVLTLFVLSQRVKQEPRTIDKAREADETVVAQDDEEVE